MNGMSRAQQRHQKKLKRAARKKSGAAAPSARQPALPGNPADVSQNRKAAQHYSAGATFREQGRFDEAIASFRKALEEEPGLTRAQLQIANIRKHTEHDDDITAMQEMYARADLTDSQRLYLAYGLGKSFEDLGDYDQAFEFFAVGNAIKRAELGYPVDPPATGLSRWTKALSGNAPSNTPMPKLAANFHLVRALFKKFSFANYVDAGCPDERPIFIIGMPRSGTTLVEQILASHSQVHGAGELFEFAKIGGTFLNQFGHDPDTFRSCEGSAFRPIGEAYVQALRRHNRGARFITDKMPENFMLVGLIRLVLPKAKIIHCRRDPRDICTSIYKQHFASRDGLEYAYDLRDLGQYYNLYSELMDWWHAMLPGLIYDIRYEELVADKEVQIKNLLAHCGLAFEDACLNFHQTDRPIRTRAEQARSPMYSSSVQSWRRYEKQMKSLFKALPSY